MESIKEIFETIENMQLAELFDELDLLDGNETPEAKIIREIIRFEINRRMIKS